MSDLIYMKKPIFLASGMEASETNGLTYRSTSNIVATIIELVHANQAASMTEIRHKVRISAAGISQYLLLMRKNGLVKYDEPSGSYKITRKGEAFLKTHRQMGEFIDIIREEIGL